MVALMKEIIHYPNLKTVLMVERTLEDADTVISKSELKRRLPTQIMHQTLNIILDYLEKSGKIYVGSKGLTWIYNDNPKLKKLLEKAVMVNEKNNRSPNVRTGHNILHTAKKHSIRRA